MKPAHLRLLSKLNRKRQLEEQEAVRTAPPPPPPRVAGPELGREINAYFHSTGGAAVGKFYRGTPVSIDETTGEYRVEYVDGAVEMHNFAAGAEVWHPYVKLKKVEHDRAASSAVLQLQERGYAGAVRAETEARVKQQRVAADAALADAVIRRRIFVGALDGATRRAPPEAARVFYSASGLLACELAGVAQREADARDEELFGWAKERAKVEGKTTIKWLREVPHRAGRLAVG